MTYDPRVHHRRSTRLRKWDYSWPSWYFVTLNVLNRERRFGEIRNGCMMLSDIGKAAEVCWRQIPMHHKGVELDEFVVMPDHMHGIVVLTQSVSRDDQLNVPTNDECRLYPSRREAMGSLSMGSLSPKKGSLSVILRTFKAAVTTWARNHGEADFAWQSRFHDRIIRDNRELDRIRAYIIRNPKAWTDGVDHS